MRADILQKMFLFLLVHTLYFRIFRKPDQELLSELLSECILMRSRAEWVKFATQNSKFLHWHMDILFSEALF